MTFARSRLLISFTYLGLYFTSFAVGSRCRLWSREAFRVMLGAATTGLDKREETPAFLEVLR